MQHTIVRSAPRCAVFAKDPCSYGRLIFEICTLDRWKTLFFMDASMEDLGSESRILRASNVPSLLGQWSLVPVESQSGAICRCAEYFLFRSIFIQEYRRITVRLSAALPPHLFENVALTFVCAAAFHERETTLIQSKFSTCRPILQIAMAVSRPNVFESLVSDKWLLPRSLSLALTCGRAVTFAEATKPANQHFSESQRISLSIRWACSAWR